MQWSQEWYIWLLRICCHSLCLGLTLFVLNAGEIAESFPFRPSYNSILDKKNRAQISHWSESISFCPGCAIQQIYSSLRRSLWCRKECRLSKSIQQKGLRVRHTNWRVEVPTQAPLRQSQSSKLRDQRHSHCLRRSNIGIKALYLARKAWHVKRRK